jgi:hypothetical protein
MKKSRPIKYILFLMVGSEYKQKRLQEKFCTALFPAGRLPVTAMTSY